MMAEYSINNDYKRVIPRDLFNESKLLKCIGKLALLIHDGHALNGMQFEDTGAAFEIGLVSDGSLTVTNITFTINSQPLFLKTTYNSKENYPLFCVHGYDEYPVFDDNGNYTEEFMELCENIYNNN
ncbi:hypothetical protein [Chitinophaga sp. CC14]|uniref:hypothetical protein n=1 Tax=Chitinophaga sp. CC14 TaxID=3029199 RepID=UPI003B97F8B1